jgi:predicted transposase YdaD
MKESKFYQEIVQEGIIEGKREAILQVIGLRMGLQTAAKFKKTVNEINDLDELTELLGAAAVSRREAELRRALAAVNARS